MSKNGFSQEDEEEKMYQRKINSDLSHAIGHIENDELGLAINILKKALERENNAKRDGDGKKKGYDPNKDPHIPRVEDL